LDTQKEVRFPDEATIREHKLYSHNVRQFPKVRLSETNKNGAEKKC